jgi:heptosyltransferase-1
VVALFGPTFPERNGPWSPADISLSRANTCVCHHKRQCRRPPACIEDIAVAEVIDAVQRRLRVHG